MAALTALPVQQPQAPRYNHPRGDLFESGRREDYIRIAVPLYRASIEGDLEAAKVILRGREHLVRYSITENKETPLHVAATGRSTKFVSYLVNMMSMVDMELRNEDGNTAFCLVAISGNVGMAKIMVKKDPTLTTTCGSEEKTPLYLAAFHGNHDMVTFLYNKTCDSWTDDDNKDAVLLKCIQAGIFDVAQRILERNKTLPQEDHVRDVMQAFARKPEAFDHVESWPIISWITSILAFTGLVAFKKSNATQLLRLLWKRLMNRDKNIIDEMLRGPEIVVNNMETYPSQILFIAAKMNNTRFLVELIREYPDLIWKVNDDGHTIFHVSVSHRYHKIYSLLYEIGSVKNLITRITDKQDNNMLHLVGKKPENNAYEDWVAPPFQAQSVFLWYKEVEAILPPYKQEKNAAGKTPQELFIENHKDLVFQGVKWINQTINQSMVVAALVCTIGFAVVYSVPGGFHQDNGFPIFLKDRHFIAFIVMDAISLILSTSSILIFLSIILSRHQPNTELVLKKWVIGQIALLTSILAIIVAFVVSFFNSYRGVYRSTVPYIIYASSIILLCLYFTVYLSLYRDAISAISSHRYIFRPKHMLYRKSRKLYMFLF